MSTLLFFEPLLVCILALAAVVYEPLLPYSVAGALLLRLLAWLARRPFWPALIHLPLILLLVMVAVSAWVTPLPRITALDSLHLLMGVLILLSFESTVMNRRTLSWAMGGLLAVTASLAGAALFFTVWADKFRFLPALADLFPPFPTRLDTAMNPNVIGGILAVLFAGILGWLFFNWGKIGWLIRLVLVLISGLLLGVIVLSQARTALLALAASLGLLALLRWRHGWIVVTLGIVVGLGVFFYNGPQEVLYQMGGETGGVTTLTKREDIWLRAKLLIADFPLTGVGMGTFGEVVDVLYPLAPQPVHITHAHNLYLQIAVDLGLPGLAAWLACWITIIWMAWQLYSNKDTFFRALGAAVLCSQFAMGVNGLLDAPTWGTRPAVLVWVIWGLTAAAWNLARPTNTDKSFETQAAPSSNAI